MRPRRASIRVRLTAWYSAIFFLLGAALLTASYAVVRHEFQRSDRTVQVRVDAPATAETPGRVLRLRIAPGVPALDGPAIRELSPSERAAYTRARAAYESAYRRADARGLRRVFVAFLGMLVLMTLASIAAGWIVAGRALRPISRITAAARGISDRTLHERIALDGPRDELRELAETFDSMLARLEGAFESRKRFVASASHELLTPIAIVRAELEVTLADPDAGAHELRAMAQVIGETNARMERLIGSLLTLASSEAGVVRRRPADLADAARAAIAGEPALGEHGSLKLHADLCPAPVLGDAVLLDQVATNLIQNAVRYNVDGGAVEIRTKLLGERAIIEVGNTGAHVGEADAATLGEPFRRLETSRARTTGGYGLGLAVVRSVAQAHGGDVAIRPRPGGGLDVRVTLPATPRVAEPLRPVVGSGRA